MFQRYLSLRRSRQVGSHLSPPPYQGPWSIFPRVWALPSTVWNNWSESVSLLKSRDLVSCTQLVSVWTPSIPQPALFSFYVLSVCVPPWHCVIHLPVCSSPAPSPVGRCLFCSPWPPCMVRGGSEHLLGKRRQELEKSPDVLTPNLVLLSQECDCPKRQQHRARSR